MRLIIFLILLAFNANGQQLVSYYKTKVKGIVNNVINHTVDDNGNLLLVGTIDHVNGDYAGSLVKLNANGVVDPGFHKVITDYPIYEIVASGQSIFASGPFNIVNGNPVNNFVKFNSDGTVDNNFSSELDNIANFALQSNGKIIVTGKFSGYKGYQCIARLNSDGTVDETFAKYTLLGSARLVAVASDNSIYFSDDFRYRIIKLDGDGQLDVNFDTDIGTNFSGSIYSIGISATDDPIIAGTFSEFNSTSTNSIAKLNPDGSVNFTFKENIGVGPAGDIYSMVIQNNGEILIGGQFSQYNGNHSSLVQLNPDGSFRKIIGVVSPNNIQSIAISDNNSISLVGGFKELNGQIHKSVGLFNPDHTINRVFNPVISETGTNQRFIHVNSAGQVYTGGDYYFDGIFDNFSPGSFSQIVRLNGLGKNDNAFAPDFEQYSSITSTAMQSDGKLVVSGPLFYDKYLVRLNLDGSIDENFDVGGGPRFMGSIAVAWKIKQKDTRIYLAANMDQFNGTPTNALVALNLDGSISQSFTSLPYGSNVYDFNFQSDGKIIVMGNLPMNGLSTQIIRLNTDGSIDNTFNPKSFVGSLCNVQIDANDNIIIGGDLYSVEGALVNGIVRLQPNGDVDIGFNTGTGFQSQVRTLEILPSGSIAVGGTFETFNGHNVNGFVLLDNTGQKISTPKISFGSETGITAMKYWENAIYLAGSMTNIELTEIYGVGKISFSVEPKPAAPDQLTILNTAPGSFEISWADNSLNETAFILERSTSEGTRFAPIEIMGANTVSVNDNSIAANIPYYYRVKATNDGGDSDYSSVVSQTWTAPLAPANLSAIQEVIGEVVLNWDDNSSDEDGFVIERSIGNATSFVQIGNSATNSISFIDHVTPNTVYFYRVAAVSSTLSLSEYSNIISVLSLYTPSPPENPMVEQLHVDKLTLTWEDLSDNEEEFIIERSVNSASNFLVVGTVGANIEVYIDNDIEEQTNYFYRISASHFASQSTYSPTASIKSLYLPVAPNQLKAKQTKMGEVSLTWRDNSENEAGFIIERSIDNGNTFIQVGQLEANTTRFNDVVGPPESFYVYRIKSFNLIGESAYSTTGQLEIVLGTGDHMNLEFETYPNPASDFIYINKEFKSNTTWHLINSLGQVLIIDSYQLSEYEAIDVRDVPIGVYVLRPSEGYSKGLKIYIAR